MVIKFPQLYLSKKKLLTKGGIIGRPKQLMQEENDGNSSNLSNGPTIK